MNIKNIKTRNKLVIAIQKKGRLNTESFKLLNACGVEITNQDDHLIYRAANFKLDLLRVRDDDIPRLVFDKVVDIGIIGLNVLDEELIKSKRKNLPCEFIKVRDLPWGHCRLSIAVPETFEYKDKTSLNGLRIATSYPEQLYQFLSDNKIDAEVVELFGSVEIAPSTGFSDVICDLVSTGTTLALNKLVEVETVFESHAVLIKRTGEFDETAESVYQSLITRINAVEEAVNAKYIMMHAPRNLIDQITEVLPGTSAPTIVEISGQPDMVALHMVSKEKDYWPTLERLKAIGASSILVLPIEQMLK